MVSNFNKYGGGNQFCDQGFHNAYFSEDADFDDGFNWQNNGPGGNFSKIAGDGYNSGPGSWGLPQNFGPPNSWGRGFGPDGPPTLRRKKDSSPVAYLLSCGVEKDIVKGLPNNILRFIYPRYCGICDEAFVSFSASRIHYTSKDHFKNQNKWMIGQHSKIELPLKDRDSYCELCDVEITSKVHADSHYKGKPHRAVIDGRKPPKNTALQHKNMADRVKQLIRRERKFIKPKPVRKTEEEVAQAKALQAEGFCPICKISVTCSEQMTMHLNGKKHLTKEKQHILKMMKLNCDEDDKKETKAEAGAKEEGGDDAVVEVKEDAEGDDKYDWGHGSEAWEE